MPATFLPLALLIGLSPAQPPEQPARVRVAAGDTLGDTAGALRKAATAAGMKEASLAWGDIATPPRGARPVRVEWGEGDKLDGWLVPADAAALHKEPGVRQVGVLAYRGGQLRVSHPSGPGSTVVPPDARDTPERRRERRETFGLFAVGREAQEPAGPALRALARAPRSFRFVLWELGETPPRE